MIISVDHGNSAIKTEHYMFPSALEQHAKRPPMANDVLEFEGFFWTLSGQRIPYMMDKTKDDRFFILTLIAIAKELLHCNCLQPGADIDLAVGLPPEHFPLLRDRFTEYLKRGVLEFSYNDMSTIVNLYVVAHCSQAFEHTGIATGFPTVREFSQAFRNNAFTL
jgi:plasmid segregation protein ParM